MALGVSKDHGAGIVAVAVQVVDVLRPELDEPLDLSGFGRAEIEVVGRLVLHARLTERERRLRARPFADVPKLLLRRGRNTA
jgi:hypothetical protein